MQPPPIYRPNLSAPSPTVATRSEPNPDLPSMADLDQLQTRLDTVDQTLADLNQTTI